MTWTAEEFRDTDSTVWPVDDLFEHDIETPENCLCGVSVEEVVAGRFMYTHHALDGRA